MIKRLVSDSFRWPKFFLALFLLFLLSAYCRYYGPGPTIPGTRSHALAHEGEMAAFPYQKVITSGEGEVLLHGGHGREIPAIWPENPPEPGTMVSFQGVFDGKKVKDVQEVIVHKGYSLKVVLSVLAGLVWIAYLAWAVGLEKKGLFVRTRGEHA